MKYPKQEMESAAEDMMEGGEQTEDDATRKVRAHNLRRPVGRRANVGKSAALLREMSARRKGKGRVAY